MLNYYSIIRGIVSIFLFVLIAIITIFFGASYLVAAIVFFALLLLDFLTIFIVSQSLYQHANPWAASINLNWYLFFSINKRHSHSFAILLWYLSDIGEYELAEKMFYKHIGDLINNQPETLTFNEALSFAKLKLYNIKQQQDCLIIEKVLNHIFSTEQNAKTKFLRGLWLLKCKKDIKNAIYMFEKARILLHNNDIILYGVIYYCLGKAWTKLGETDYANDQFLKAKIYFPDVVDLKI